MIAYTTLGSNDLPKTKQFYDRLFGENGIKTLWETDNFIGYGHDMNLPMFAICRPYDKQPATVGNGSMIALQCPDRTSVDTLYSTALELGATDEGAPGKRINFYIAYFRDPDGHKIAAFAFS